MRKSVVAIAAAIVVVGAAVAAVPIVERRAADNIKEQIESDRVTKVDRVEVGLFDRSVTLHRFRADEADPVSADLVVASGLAWPLGELLKGNTPFAGWRAGDPVQARRVEMKGVHYSEPTGRSWTMGSLVADGVDLARFDAEVAPSAYRNLTLGARFNLALGLRRLEVQDVRVAENSLGAGFTLGSLVMNDVHAGKFGSIEMAGFAVPGAKPGTAVFQLDQVKVTGFDMERMLKAFSNANWRLGMPTGRLDLDKASATGFGGEAMARYGISLGSVTADVTREKTGVSHMRSRVDGFVLAPPLRGLEGLQVRMALTAMGLKELKLGFDCVGTEDRPKGVVTVDSCALSGPGLAEIDFSARIQDADEAFWRAVDVGDYSRIGHSKVTLGSARLVMADKSLLERTFRAIATLSGHPVDEERAATAQQIRQYQPPGVLITDDLTKMLDTVARFVEKGGTLTVELKPDPPLGIDKLGYLSSPGPDLIELLGAKATLAAPN